MTRFTIWIIAVFALCGAAWATPERITRSDDRIVAGTQTHLYVLRDIDDNLGSHYAALQDQHLVEISLDSGEATRFWPLRRMSLNLLEGNTFNNPGKVTDLDGDVDDMTVILREVGAQPLAPYHWAVQDLALVEGALMRGDVPLATPFAIRATGRGQLAILRDTYPPIETEEEYMRAERIAFYDLYAEGDWSCELRPEGQVLFRNNDRVLAAKLNCEDAAYSGIWSFHVLVSEPL